MGESGSVVSAIFPTNCDQLLDYVSKNWRAMLAVIEGAPMAFAVSVVLVGGILGLALRTLFSVRLKNQATQIAALEQQVSTEQSRITFRDDRIRDFEARLQAAITQAPPSEFREQIAALSAELDRTANRRLSDETLSVLTDLFTQAGALFDKGQRAAVPGEQAWDSEFTAWHERT